MLLLDDQPFYVHHGDTILHMMQDMSPACIDFAMTSPPFPKMYAYNKVPNDIGNSENLSGDGKIHLSFFYRAVKRIIKPGRVLLVDVMQIPRYKRDGGVGRGLYNFRDLNIRLGERAGLIYEYDWAVRHNPQAQAITTRSRELQFAGLEADRARSRGALPSFLIKFTAPGDNQKPLDDPNQVSRNRWIDLAEHEWDTRRMPLNGSGKMGLTLNVKSAKGKDDVLHVCPFHLSVCYDAVSLFSDPGEIVFDPFNGVGSVGFEALQLNRRYYGCEIKNEYYDESIKNLNRAIRMRDGSDQVQFDFGDDDESDEVPIEDDDLALASEES